MPWQGFLSFSTLQSWTVFPNKPRQLQSTPAYQASSPGQFRGSAFWAWPGSPPSLSPSPSSPGLNSLWLRGAWRVLGLPTPLAPITGGLWRALLPCPTTFPSCLLEGNWGPPEAGPGSPSSLQWEGAEIQRTTGLGPLDKQAQGGCKGGGGCRGLQPCWAQTMQSVGGLAPGPAGPVHLLNVLPPTRGNPFTSFSNKSIRLHISLCFLFDWPCFPLNWAKEGWLSEQGGISVHRTTTKTERQPDSLACPWESYETVCQHPGPAPHLRPREKLARLCNQPS